MNTEPGRTEQGRQSIAAPALAIGGLVVAVGALNAMQSSPVAGGPSVRVALDLPEPLVSAVFALVALAGVLMLWLMFARRRPRRRRGEDEPFELYHEPPKVSPWVIVLLLALALVPLAALIALVWQGWTPPVTVTAHAPGRALGPRAGLPWVSNRAVTSAPAFRAAVIAVAVLAGIATLGFVLWILAADRLWWWWLRAPVAGQEREPLIETVDAGLDDLRRYPDPRRAITECYRRFEQWSARAGFPRARWATHTEFTRAALAKFALPPDAVQRLAGLFEVSRFSDHVIGPADRDAAVASLTEIRSALEARQSDAPTA